MPKVTFVQPDGTRITHTLAAGESVMDGALDNDIPGILGQCGGGCTCATCHCYVGEQWLKQLPAPHPDELAILDYVLGRRTNSRLGCQIFLNNALDGLTVEVPARQA